MRKLTKNNKIGSNRSFGFVFFIVFLIIGLWPLFNDNGIRIWSILLSSTFLILTIINSKILTPFNRIWMKLGLVLGLIVAPLVMGIVFFIVVTPTGLILRLMGKDPLSKKYSNKLSYWVDRNKNIGSMKKQF